MDSEWKNNIENFKRIYIKINISRTWFPFQSDETIFLIVHSPNNFGDLSNKIILKQGTLNSIYYSPIKINLLEGNYEPKCRNYNQDSDGLLLTSNDCIVECLFDLAGHKCLLNYLDKPVLGRNIINLSSEQGCPYKMIDFYQFEVSSNFSGSVTFCIFCCKTNVKAWLT